MPQGDDQTDVPTAVALDHARAEFERTTLARARAYAESDGSSLSAQRSARAAREANQARRAYERALLAHAGVSDPGLHHLP